MWSQSSVAPQHCKVNPAPSLLKTAIGKWRQWTACQYLEVPHWWLMVLWGGHRVCQWRWHSLVRWRISDRRSLSILHWNPGVCVYLSIGGPAQLAVEALEPPGTWLYKQLWKETFRKHNQYERSDTKNEKQMLKSTKGYKDASSSLRIFACFYIFPPKRLHHTITLLSNGQTELKTLRSRVDI